MSEEDKGFTVKDSRAFASDGTPKGQEAAEGRENEAAEGREQEAAKEKADEPARDKEETGRTGPLPQVEFGGLIISLSHAAMMHLGQIPDPNTGESRLDKALARHTIDTIAMLKEKTEGNLTDEEQSLITTALTELRMAFVKLAS